MLNNTNYQCNVTVTVPQFCIPSRLIKGDGEVLEEIVSRDRHLQINRQATMADGDFFQSQTIHKQSTKTTGTFF